MRPEASSASILPLTSSWFNHVKTVESYVGQLFSDWSDTFSTEVKVSYRDYSSIRVSPTTAPAIQVYFDDGVTGNGNDNPIGTNNNSFAGLDAIRLGTERSSPGNTLLTETWDYYAAGVWTVGDHDIKFGGSYSENEIYNFFLQDAWGNYSFYVPLTGGVSNFGNLQRGQYFDYDLQANPTDPDAIAARYTNKNLGVFVQDLMVHHAQPDPDLRRARRQAGGQPGPAVQRVLRRGPGHRQRRLRHRLYGRLRPRQHQHLQRQLHRPAALRLQLHLRQRAPDAAAWWRGPVPGRCAAGVGG